MEKLTQLTPAAVWAVIFTLANVAWFGFGVAAYILQIGPFA